jgi:polyphosphate glucokinase
MHVLGIDIGGSSLKAAPVNTLDGRLLAPRERFETPEVLSPEEMAAAVSELARRFSWRGPVGVGFPGVVQQGRIRTSANLHADFIGLDAAELFSRATGLPTEVLNDADAAGLAEVALGAGRGIKGAILMLTFGTGVGSALCVDGILYPNTEFGHLPREGQSWEKLVSGAAKERRGLDYPAWAAEVEAYLRELEALVWPDLIIAGGGISADHARWFPFVRTRARLVAATLGNDAGLVGAALAAARAGAA